MKPLKLMVVAGAGAAVAAALIGAGPASASTPSPGGVPDAAGVVHSCYTTNPALKPVVLIDPSRGTRCPNGFSALNFNQTHTLFVRAENVEKDEFFQEGDPKHGQLFNVSKASLGYIYDFPEWNHLRWGLGGLGSVSILPGNLDEDYSDTPVSFMVFARVKL